MIMSFWKQLKRNGEFGSSADPNAQALPAGGGPGVVAGTGVFGVGLHSLQTHTHIYSHHSTATTVTTTTTITASQTPPPLLFAAESPSLNDVDVVDFGDFKDLPIPKDGEKEKEPASRRMPAELLSLIATFVELPADRVQLAAVNSHWAAATTRLLWAHVSLVSPKDVLRFLRSSIYTVASHNQQHLLQHLPAISASTLTDINSLPKVDLSAINVNPLPALMNALNGNLQDLQQHWQQQQQLQQLHQHQQHQHGQQNPNMMDVEYPMAGLTNLVNSIVQIAMTNPNASPSSSDAMRNLTSANFTKYSVDMEIDNFRSFGSAEYVKKLSIPSFDCQVNLLGLLNDLLPNLQSGTPYTAIFTPVDPILLQTFKPIISRVTKLAIEDVYPTSWPEILKLLGGGINLLALDPPPPPASFSTSNKRRHQQQQQPQKLVNLRCLNLEAVATTDSFDSPVKLSAIFSSIPNLEAARFDGIAIGPDTSILSLAQHCPHLKVIALDYCPNVTMKSFEVLWNELKGLEFLGLAGIVNEQQNPNHQHAPHPPANVVYSQQQQNLQKRGIQLKRHESIRIVRLVDCDVSDELFWGISQSGVGLEMLRFVFEDDECEGIIGVVERLSERALLPFAQDLDDVSGGGIRKGLKKLAFTWCPSFNVDCLRRVLEYGWGNGYGQGVEVLDLHKDVSCSLGEIPGNVLEQCAEFMGRVKVLNLYGQTKLSNETLQAIFTAQNFASLNSLCINDSCMTPQTLRQIIVGIPNLNSISIIQCENIKLEDLKQLFLECPMDMRRIKRLYTEHCWNTPPTATGAADPFSSSHSSSSSSSSSLFDTTPMAGGIGGGSEATGVSSVRGAPEEGMLPEDEDLSLSPLIPAAEMTTGTALEQEQDWGGIHDEMMDTMDDDEEDQEFQGADTGTGISSSEALNSNGGAGGVNTGHSSNRHRNLGVKGTKEDLEPKCIIHEDLWFVDEGLDIMSLFNGSVKRATDLRI
ncbi:UNVERIFIED_CONTAM: hypothetical protein HDU68_001761 [Siphonaria sp. JEL0065]|nr:hypothetical protein HDU68_001761 [Siphonaria sp. JEL0065]